MVDLNIQYELSSEAIVQEVNGESVILDLKSEQYFSLNEVGTRVWQILREQPLLADVYQTLLDEYDIDEETLGRDLETLMNMLISEGLVACIKDD